MFYYETKLKGITFVQDLGYSLPLLSFLQKKEEKIENELAKIVIKSHAFQPGLTMNMSMYEAFTIFTVFILSIINFEGQTIFKEGCIF